MSDVKRNVIEKRIEQLKAQRDQFVRDANTQIAATNMTIAELERLLKEQEDEPEPDE